MIYGVGECLEAFYRGTEAYVVESEGDERKTGWFGDSVAVTTSTQLKRMFIFMVVSVYR